MPFSPLRVHLVEDSDLFRGLLSAYLKDIPGLTVTGASSSAAAAIEEIHASRPDLVVLDMQLASGTGLDVLHALQQQDPRPRVFLLSNHSDPQTRQACLAAGAAAFYDKTSEFTAFMETLRQLASAP